MSGLLESVGVGQLCGQCRFLRGLPFPLCPLPPYRKDLPRGWRNAASAGESLSQGSTGEASLGPGRAEGAEVLQAAGQARKDAAGSARRTSEGPHGLLLLAF